MAKVTIYYSPITNRNFAETEMEDLRLWPSDKTLAKLANVLEVEIYRLFVPQTLAMQSETISELKHAVVKTVETLVHDTLQDWERQ